MRLHRDPDVILLAIGLLAALFFTFVGVLLALA